MNRELRKYDKQCLRKRIKSALVFLYLIIIFTCVEAQIGGTATYSFLDLTPSASVAALGGKVNATPGADPSLSFYNPGLLDSTANNCLSLNFVNLFAGVNYGYVSFSRSYSNIGNFAAGIHYINYGKFIEADASGIISGDFTAAEYAFNFTYSRTLPYLDSLFIVGMSIKPLLSVFERYTSYGLLSDAGLTYRHPNNQFTAALVLRNMGGQITPYADGKREPVHFELQLGLSHRLQHAPFRISFVLRHLEKKRLGYNKTNLNPQPGQKVVKKEDLKKGMDLFLDEALRHVLVGIECFPFQGLTLRAGYNYNRRQEMKIENMPGMVGFSWGIAVNISRFNIDYARSTWHLAGACDHISISANFK